MSAFSRNIAGRLLEALADSPVVALYGPRQSGKSTLAESLVGDDFPATYTTLDDLPLLAAARNDPVGFIHELGPCAIIDEVQRVPELLLTIKASVDRNRQPGRFLLTGSAHALTAPRVADSLVGRIQTIVMWPLSQGEIAGHKDGFVDALFAEHLAKPVWRPGKSAVSVTRDDLIGRITTGGFPVAVQRTKPDKRDAWFDAYVDTMIQRDVKDLAEIEGVKDIPRLLGIMASRAGGLLNLANAARDAGMSHMTFRRYLSLLHAVYLVHTVPAWHTKRLKRLMKSEKVYFSDTGVLARLLDLPADRLHHDTMSLGMLVENFVAMELLKQITWSRSKPALYHLRDYAGLEVDFLLEGRGGRRIVAIEVKSSATVNADDFKSMRRVAKELGAVFHRGVVLYTGNQVVPFGPNLYALPMPYLWSAYAPAAAHA